MKLVTRNQQLVMIQNFYDLDAWKEAKELTILVYVETKNFPSEEKFGLTSQLRRSANSVAANIAEGFERYHFKDKIRFYHQARGSAAEVISHCLIAEALRFLPAEKVSLIKSKSEQSMKLLNGLIRSIEKQIHKE